jgi:uncharacterized BrkB/YihY/UPF0761 family membrane protein
MKYIMIAIVFFFEFALGMLLFYYIISTFWHLFDETVDIIEEIFNEENIAITVPCLLVVAFSYFWLFKIGDITKDRYRHLIFWKK